MDSRTYNINDAQFDALATMLLQHGLTIDPTQPHGTIESGSWSISYELGDGTITINLLHRPMLEEGAFWSKLDGLLGQSPPITH